jgi:GNAT superfamily N-acetyltransferase
VGRYVERIQYWLAIASDELKTFTDPFRVGEVFNGLDRIDQLHAYELDGEKGVIAYAITDDMLGGLAVCELFMYIKPEYRGSVRLFKELVNHLEQVAKENNCSCVKIASNIGFKDDTVLKILQRWGYKTDSVSKKV